MSATQITAEIDPAAEDKQAGYPRIPHSVHRSALGWLPVPAVASRTGEGPTLAMPAGVHGDDHGGQIARSRLVRDPEPEQISGRIILLPMADCLIDLHSGGRSQFNPPTLLRGHGHTSEETVTLRMLQRAFDLPYAWVIAAGGGPNSTAMGAGK